MKSPTELEDQIKSLKNKVSRLRRTVRKLKNEAADLEAAASGPKVSPLAPASFPQLPPIDGVRFAAAAAAVKYKGRLDVMLTEISPGSSIAGVFTRSATRAEPVRWCESNLACLQEQGARKGGFAILVNSGNANAFTGAAGLKAVSETAKATAKALKCRKEHVFLASTGVIGEPLPAERVVAKIDELVSGLSADRASDAAHAIMTTDTFAKGAMAEVNLNGTLVRITGFAKGSGMIAPDMATMLVFIFTDAAIDRAVLQTMLAKNTGATFNSITVDSDTSTSDTLLLAATGKSGMEPIASMRDRRAVLFQNALADVMRDLALQVVRDGEGATKLLEICVTGAKTDRSAHAVGMAIANSPLVKTAVAGEDPNWGRVVMAIGKSGEPAERDRLTIRFGDVLVAEKGWVAPSYTEKQGAAVMKKPEIRISVDMGLGGGSSTVWTCDLTHQYISINADYRS